MNITIDPADRLEGEVIVPGDKSIAHRALILGALATGEQKIEGLPDSEDVAGTAACLKALDVSIEERNDRTVIVRQGRWMKEQSVFAGNSGTTARLLSGLVAGKGIRCTIDGDASLRKRPMKRIVEPLERMGARIDAAKGTRLPMTILSEGLEGIRFEPEAASAQVKSAVLIAGLFASGRTTVIEPKPTRDHTELMLRAMGVEVRTEDTSTTESGISVSDTTSSGTVASDTPVSDTAASGIMASDTTVSDTAASGTMASDTTVSDTAASGITAPDTTAPGITASAITVSGGAKPCGVEVVVPGDVSSAIFFIVAAQIISGAEIRLPNVGINPTRTGALIALERMGARIAFENQRTRAGEPIADIAVRSGNLHGIKIEGKLIPLLIDELPILAVAASLAEGRTVVRDAAELRFKESDRIESTVINLRRMGVDIEALEDGFVIEGPCRLKGGHVESFGDHRIAMAMAVAGLAAEGKTVIRDSRAVGISYPGFFEDLKRLVQ